MRTRPAYRTAIDAIALLLEQARRTGANRLPPSRKLAGTIGVSLPTVLQALHHFRQNGEITTCPGRGTLLVPQDSAAAALPPGEPSAKWERVRAAIAADVLAGVDRPHDDLPSVKQLCSRYGASPATVRKAARSLAQCGVLRETAHGWGPRVVAARERSGVVVLLALGASRGGLALTSSRTFDHLRGLQRACSRAGVMLVSVPEHRPWDVDVADAWRRIGAAAGSRPLLGVVVWAVALRCDWGAFVSSRPSPSLPIALLDEVGDATLAETARRTHVRLFSMAHSTIAGGDVARWLIARGHRHVAFFSPDHASTFSQNRLSGLRQAFGALGLEGNVHVHTADSLYQTVETIQASEEGAQLLSEAAALVRGGSDPKVSPRHAIAGALEAHGARLAFKEIEQWVIARHFAPSFRSCVRNRRITAWVALTDVAALACRRFLDTRDRHVALVGFDNSEVAATHGLTSYDFNGSAVMHAMVSYVLAPRWRALPSDTASPVEIGGYVVARG